jgi:hypothetical protein
VTNMLAVVPKAMRKSYSPRAFGHHVVLMGHLEYDNTSAFVDEFFVGAAHLLSYLARGRA